MRVDIEVKRVRASVTQGEAQVYMNGHYVMSFGDTIEMVKDDAPYYGENIGGWASIKPDTAFVRGLLCHDYEKIYQFHEKIGSVLDVVESEEKGDSLDILLRKQHAYVMTCGGYGNIREADGNYNDLMFGPGDISQIAPGENRQFQPKENSQRLGMKLVG